MVKSIFIHKLENSYQVEVVNSTRESKFLSISEALEGAISTIIAESAKQPTERELEILEKEEKLQMETAEKNTYFKILVERIPGIFTDEEIKEKIEAFPYWSGDGEIHKYGEYYRYGDKLYRVIYSVKDEEGNEVGFTTQPDWTPDIAISLYVEVLPPDVIPPWRQPTGAHDAYGLGARVIYDNKIYESKIEANTTIPGSDERWWKLIEDLTPEEPVDPENPEEPTDPEEPIDPEEPVDPELEEPTVEPWEDRWSINQTGYITGDIVTHNGFYWISKIGAPGNWNVYEPSDAAHAAWEKGDSVV